MSPMTAANEGERKPLYITWAKKAPNPKHVTLRPRRERTFIIAKSPCAAGCARVERTSHSFCGASITRVAAGAFGFLIFSHAFDWPDLYGALSFFETMPSSPKWQTARL
jgi:hypothetical protein